MSEQITLTGTIADGVEFRCRMLETASGTYQILGGTHLPNGTAVRVTGIVRRDVATTCQQGIPLQIVSMEPRLGR